jgi:2',3'-cyclic-nucleotide 2'-phosphodiesterase (5'-nucleotidase family)
LRREETNFANFYADLAKNEFKTDVAMINTGTIRSNCLIPEGELTFDTLRKIVPFEDTFVTMEI